MMLSYDLVKAAVGPEPLGLQEIQARTGCPPRTIRYAVRRLVEDGVLRKTWNLRDTRRTLYYREVRS